MARSNKANRDAFVSIPAEVKEMLRHVIPAVQQMPKIDRIDGAGGEMKRAAFGIIEEFYMAWYAQDPKVKTDHLLAMSGKYGCFVAAFEIAVRQGILKDGFKLPIAMRLERIEEGVRKWRLSMSKSASGAGPVHPGDPGGGPVGDDE